MRFDAIHLLTFLNIVTRAISYWWILMHEIKPTTHPLPDILRCYGEPLRDDTFFMDEHFIDENHQETSYGVAIRNAWNAVDRVDRELMFFSCVVQEDYEKEILSFAHPDVMLDRAFDVLECDLMSAPQLQFRALSLIYEHRHQFT
jgi:hypothetical protein